MTNSEFINTWSKTEAEQRFCSEMRDLAKIVCAPPEKRLNADEFARHALKALRAGWLATREWSEDAADGA